MTPGPLRAAFCWLKAPGPHHPEGGGRWVVSYIQNAHPTTKTALSCRTVDAISGRKSEDFESPRMSGTPGSPDMQGDFRKESDSQGVETQRDTRLHYITRQQK